MSKYRSSDDDVDASGWSKCCAALFQCPFANGDAEKGWRVALRYALGDVAQNALMKPGKLAEKQSHQHQTILPLFED